MTINFTTYFDKNYQHKFYTLYKSLELNCKNFHVYAFYLGENEIDETLEKTQNVTFISLAKLEYQYPDLYYAKKNRSIVEYYFTLTPFICRYIFEVFKLNQITYLDSDLFFFNNPENLYNFIEQSSSEIFITEHDNKKFEKKYGRFNVGWIVFKNKLNANKCLYDWGKNCIHWCFDDIKKDKFADQKYLDKWIEDYENVFIVNDHLINIGPWNFNKITLSNSDNLISFHFHNLNIVYEYFFITNISSFHNLSMINKNLIKKIYSKYVKLHIINQNLFPNLNIIKIRSQKLKNKIRRLLKFVIAILKNDYFKIK